MTVENISATDLDGMAQRANAAHRLAHDAAARAVEHAMEAGCILLAAKAVVGHGNWLDWLDRNVEFADRTARLYMRLAETVPTLPDTDRQRVAEMSLRQAAKAISSTNTLSVMGSSASPEWYTPAHVADLVVDTLGEVDLDPSWHPDSPVRARVTYTVENDGLAQPWQGRVYLNPPYGRTIDAWIEKLVTDHAAGTISEAIALVPARVDTQWFRRLDPFPRCFISGRLQFSNAGHPAPFPSAAVYLGPNVERFYSVFAPLGGIFVRLAYAMLRSKS